MPSVKNPRLEDMDGINRIVNEEKDEIGKWSSSSKEKCQNVKERETNCRG